MGYVPGVKYYFQALFIHMRSPPIRGSHSKGFIMDKTHLSTGVNDKTNIHEFMGS